MFSVASVRHVQVFIFPLQSLSLRYLPVCPATWLVCRATLYVSGQFLSWLIQSQHVHTATGVVMSRHLETLWMLFCLYFSCGALAADPVVLMASLEWPPYVSQHLPGQGIISQRVRMALAHEGYQVQIRFLPWKRAVAMIQNSTSYIGIFPEYASPQRQREFYCSDPISQAPLAFIQDARLPSIDWLRLEDLAGYRIGTVAGYINTPEFDALVARKALVIDEAQNDVANLKKLLRGRIELAVIDPVLYGYLLRHDPEIKSLSGRLRLVPRLLGQMQLVACFRHDAEGKRLRNALNRGLLRLDK